MLDSLDRPEYTIRLVGCLLYGAAANDDSYVKDLERSLKSATDALHEKGLLVPQTPDRSFSADLEIQLHNAASDNGPSLMENPQQGPTNTSLIDLEAISSARKRRDDGQEKASDEFTDVNCLTQEFEFHGHTSALAFLGRLLTTKGDTRQEQAPTEMVQRFQNDRLSMQRATSTAPEYCVESYFPHHAILFIDAYFKSIHYVYPVIDQDIFMDRSQALWDNSMYSSYGPIHRSFKALYFAVLSLGALTRTWTEGTIGGMNRQAWSDKLFAQSEDLLGRPGSTTNLEAVQTMIVLAQVCQHQINPNLAYTYLGLAIRTVFSSGMNRLAQFRSNFPQDSPSLVVSRTWWALYCLETECSVMLGRPDILGSDSCHNRPPPAAKGESANIIVPAMLGLSRIVRGVSREIYWDQADIATKMKTAGIFMNEMYDWLANLPEKIRPTAFSDALVMSEHYSTQLQMFMLKLREYFLRLKPGSQLTET